MTKEYAVDEETALAEFERFCDTMDLEVDESDLDDESRAELEKLRSTIVKRIRSGDVVINEKGEPEFTPTSGGSTIVFYEPNGRTLTAMDLKKPKQQMGKFMAILAAMTKQPEKRFHDMPLRDYRVCQSIAQLFFG